MSGGDKKGRERGRPADTDETTGQRDTFLHAFFKKGAQIAEDLVQENDLLRRRVLELDEQNAAMRTQLASDEAIREALHKIAALEREKNDLLSRMTDAAATSTRSLARYEEVENDLADLANLYVASDQLHGTLELSRVIAHVGELLEQLVGARAHAVYFLDESRAALAPIGAHNVDRERLPVVPLRADDARGAVSAIERALLTGVPVVDPELSAAGHERPAACIPLLLDGRAVGVVVVYALLSQKTELTQLDHELFRMLGAHAATAITGALLWSAARGRLPALPQGRPPADPQR